MAKAGKNTSVRTVEPPRLGPSENRNDSKFQGVYDALEALRERLAANPRKLHGRIVVEIPYEGSVVQQVAVTDKRVER